MYTLVLQDDCIAFPGWGRHLANVAYVNELRNMHVAFPAPRTIQSALPWDRPICHIVRKGVYAEGINRR